MGVSFMPTGGAHSWVGETICPLVGRASDWRPRNGEAGDDLGDLAGHPGHGELVAPADGVDYGVDPPGDEFHSGFGHATGRHWRCAETDVGRIDRSSGSGGGLG